MKGYRATPVYKESKDAEYVTHLMHYSCIITSSCILFLLQGDPGPRGPAGNPGIQGDPVSWSRLLVSMVYSMAYSTDHVSLYSCLTSEHVLIKITSITSTSVLVTIFGCIST